MDLLATSKTLLGTVHDLYTYINANRTLRKRYGEALNALILLQLLLQRITSSSRIPEEAEPCLAEIEHTLQQTNTHLRKRVRASKRTGFWLKAMVWVWNDDFERINKKIATLTTRLELLLQLKEVLDNDARFDASKVLEDVGQDAREFWDNHFGSETLMIPIGTFLQSLELAENRRLQHAEREVVSRVLDPDQDGSVSVYEFARWLRHFGPVQDAMATTLTSLFDAKHNRVHGWFHQDLFWDGVVKLIDGQPGACIVRYGVGETMFIIDVCDSNGNIHEICVARENGAFRPVLCNDETDMQTDEDDMTPAWLLRAMRIVTDKMDFTFETIPDILKCLADVILFHPTHIEEMKAAKRAPQQQKEGGVGRGACGAAKGFSYTAPSRSNESPEGSAAHSTLSSPRAHHNNNTTKTSARNPTIKKANQRRMRATHERQMLHRGSERLLVPERLEAFRGHSSSQQTTPTEGFGGDNGHHDNSSQLVHTDENSSLHVSPPSTPRRVKGLLM